MDDLFNENLQIQHKYLKIKLPNNGMKLLKLFCHFQSSTMTSLVNKL